MDRSVILAVLLFAALGAVYLLIPDQLSGDGGLKNFRSYQEMAEFLENSSTLEAPRISEAVASVTAGVRYRISQGGTAPDHSTTNVQVPGVDEADIVKTDGSKIYVGSGTEFFVISAQPLETVKRFSLDGAISGIYLTDSGAIVITSRGNTTVRILDPESMELKKLLEVSGYYTDSRLVDGRLYLITQEPAGPPLPKVPVVNGVRVKPQEVYYFPDYSGYTSFTVLTSLDLRDGSVLKKVFLTGPGISVYASRKNVYIVYPKRLTKEEIAEEFVKRLKPYLPEDLLRNISEIEKTYPPGERYKRLERLFADFVEKNPEKAAEIRKEAERIAGDMVSERTVIHRISLSDLGHAAAGSVPGRVLNQFSMDENGDYFRIATTSFDLSGTTKNNIFVLDSGLSVVGSLENFAPGERIYSVRFLGDNGYVVTFRRTDPLFVVDLSDPGAPKFKGKLKIPGASFYLHPMNGYLIGVGLNATETGRFTTLKVSVFDVSGSPKEVASVTLPERFSAVLQTHKAFTVGPDSGVFMIPSESGVYALSLGSAGNLSVLKKFDHPWAIRSLYAGRTVFTLSAERIRAFEFDTGKFVSELELRAPGIGIPEPVETVVQKSREGSPPV